MSESELEQLYSMIKIACDSTDTQSQQLVYNQLSAVEQNPQFYISLAAIISNSQVQNKYRQMALLTLKSALSRNESQLQFTEEQFSYLKNILFKLSHIQNQSISNSQKSVISLLALWGKQLDFQILAYLTKISQSQSLAQKIWALQTLYIIFEDIKFETQNFQFFEKQEFQQFLKVFMAIFTINMKQNNIKLIQKSMLCMNLLLKYVFNIDSTSQTIKIYLMTYLLPLINNKGSAHKLLQIALDGITQISETNPSIIFESDFSLSSISNFHNNKKSVMRNWLSLLLDLLNADSQYDKLKMYLPILIPKIIPHLVFTKQDELNVKLQMEEQNNPYQYEQEQSNDDCNNKSGYGYTNRKLSVLLLQSLFVQYTQQAWNLTEPVLKQLLSSKNLDQLQCGILMLGIIFEKMEDHLQFLQSVLPFVLQQISNFQLPDLLRCTCLWALAKVAYIISRNDTLNKQVQACLIKCLHSSQSNQQIRDTVYSTLDQLICCSEQLPFYFTQIMDSIQKGIKNCSGKHFYSVLKTCSTLYQRHPQKIHDEITLVILQNLCQKWSANKKIQSIMSPILQCLVTIAAANSKVFKIYAYEIFKQAFSILQNQHQKTMLLRAIDLLSSIISIQDDKVLQIIKIDTSFHKGLHLLLTSEQKQIKNFSYGLLGDICKVCAIPQFAQGYLQVVGKSFDETSLTSCSNALTCLTDLIVSNPGLAPQYSKTIMALAIKKIKTPHLEPIYAFNFARAFGRLGCLNPKDGCELLKQNLNRVCFGMRARESHKLTDQAFRGIFNMLLQAPQQFANSFEFLVQCFICYPCGDRQVSQTFATLLKSYRQSLNAAQWKSFLAKPIFLPAVAKKIQNISV